MQYRMLGLDLDGTLLGSDGRISSANQEAIAAAARAGIRVVPCTGRGWRESVHVLAELKDLQEGVFVGGAVVNRIADGQALSVTFIDPALALRVVRELSHLPEAVLVFREAGAAGHDYLVTGRGSLSPQTQWWFERTGATVHFQEHVEEADLSHTLRVGIVADSDRVLEVRSQLARVLGDQVFVQSFAAVQEARPGVTIDVLEIFTRGVDKWRGLSWIARQQGIDPKQIAVIGDQINDVAMIRAAGCGIAMGNAIDAAKEVAAHVTLTCDQHGVAHAITQLLAGQWGRK
ncbi:MAG: HAD-IIB family hydrolase [Phycisphaeraceae bacterium]|nr:HAD-IIB family hydrolase [Phycisphaeraceae bacterium]